MAIQYTVTYNNTSLGYTVGLNTGPTGPQGVQGIQGPTGPTGSDANITLANVRAAVPDMVEVATPAENDFIQRGPSGWLTKTIAQVKTALGLGTAAYTASTDYAPVIEYKSASFTAEMGKTYYATGSLTITDPVSPNLNEAYCFYAIGGSVTVLGMLYLSGSYVSRKWGGFSWETQVFRDSSAYATAAQGALATNAQPRLKGVVVTKKDGSRTAYPPSADTDTARGLALEAAFTAAVAGDTIDLSPGSYLITKAYSGSTVGAVVADFAILDSMTIRLNGARLYRTTPATVTAGAFVIGRHYTIISGGTTNFVSEQGATNNTPATSFVAIAAGTGTGTAILTPPVMFAVAHVTAVMGGSNWSLIGPGILEGTAATTTTTGYANEIGLNVMASRAWKIDSVSFRKFRGAGLQLNSATFTGDPTGYNVNLKVSTGHVSNCNFDLNNVGMGCYAGNEYTAFTNCTFNQNLTGADVYAGNTKFMGCEASNNTNFALRIRNGGNDGHGCWIGGWITHNPGFAVSAEASMDFGFQFTGATFGADSVTTNKIQSLGGGLNFVGCYMESPFFASATPTGNNFMSNCFISGTYTVHTDLSTAERLKWKFTNNHTLTGPWASNDAYAYVYADNAAALTGGLLAGEQYRTSTGETRIVY